VEVILAEKNSLSGVAFAEQIHRSRGRADAESLMALKTG
jgi:hypothetical protein